MPPVTSASRSDMTSPRVRFGAWTILRDYCTARNLGHVEPAVDGNVRSGDVTGLLGSEVGDQAGHLVGLREPPHRDLLDDRLENLRLHGFDHIRLDVARRDRVDRHPLFYHFLGERLGEPVHASLGRRIVGLTELTLQGVYGGDVDDTAPAALHHALDYLARDVEDAVEIGVHHRVPVGGRHAFENG